jgi:sarcosine oxidase subunit beta
MTERLAVDVAIIGGGTAAVPRRLRCAKRGHGGCPGKAACAAPAPAGSISEACASKGGISPSCRSRVGHERYGTISIICSAQMSSSRRPDISSGALEADMAELERYAENAREHGLALTLLGANALRDELPWIGPRIFGASLSPTDGQANPRVVGPAYARLARERGAEVWEFAPVRHAVSTGAGFEVEADGVTVRSRWLVNAAGAGAGEVASWFGERAPVSPLMPNMLVTEPLPHLVSRSIGVCGGDIYVRQIRRGNVIFGGGHGWGDAELGLARPHSEESLGCMPRAVDISWPSDTGSTRTWSGVDGQMPDQIPVIGFSSTTPRLVHAFGFSGHGFQLGPVIGLIVAELIDKGKSISPIAPFAPQRFADWADKPEAARGGVEH